MLYRLPTNSRHSLKAIKEFGQQLGGAFGWGDIWRFRSFKKNVITSDRNWHKVAYIEIDRPEDCVYFELTFEKTMRA